MSAASTPALDVERWNGGRRWVLGGGLLGLVLIAITLIVGALSDDPKKPAFFSYLVAFAYWCGIGIASVVLLLIMHTVKAKWVTVVRRPIEVMAATIGVFLLLAIPVILTMKHVYVWVDPPAGLPHHEAHLLHHKAPYLNKGFFVVRLVIYFALWTFLAERLFKLSKRQDGAGTLEAVDLLAKQRRLTPGFIPFVALTFSFAAFDWLMSLTPTWFSTIYGVYYFAGSFVSALSMLALVTYVGRAKAVFGAAVSPEHTHNIGKLMLAFTCFWGYIAFSQFMLIWIAGLPEEVPYFITRLAPGWAPIGILLIIGHFFIPFGAMLSRSLKRDPKRLALVACWILFIHYVDIIWLVIPALTPDGFSIRFTDFTAFFGVGLCAVAFGVSRLRGQFPVPVRDPYLAEALRYRQP